MTDDRTRLDADATRLGADDATRLGNLGDATRMAGNDQTVLSVWSQPGRPRRERPDLEPGAMFGSYRIVSLLGRGGMGEVYEAEHVEHERRVALKVLNQQLASDEDRARFLSEGRLAASINHPNSVYVFGSEEIDGTPIITMELLSGGTLKDRVVAGGPLDAAAAVDAILQIIAGLDAANAIGILHRDIKPSNCFVDVDGSTKIGDFGLSISTIGSGVAATSGMFMGTPQFAAPEQLRGEALDVRADIYALGATLYYLLTGRPPFDDGDLTTLITRVKMEAPASPRLLRPPVSRGLARVVLRMLAKAPADRPASYKALAASLRPYGSTASRPALMGLRFAAGVIDQVLLSLLVLPFTSQAALRVSFDTAERGAHATPGPPIPAWTVIASTIASLAYYGLLEGLTGASIGKRLFGLRVVDGSGRRLGVPRAAMRAAIFAAPQWIAASPALIYGTQRLVELGRTSPLLGLAFNFGIWGAIALMFVTVRRRNGFAAVHDLATRARVVARDTAGARARSKAQPAPPTTPLVVAREVGPFTAAATIGATAGGGLLLGRDPVLQRDVWLCVSTDAPALSPARRALARGGRLRWLMGRRGDGDAWDAYEALDGAPLLAMTATPQPWSVVKHWLADLSAEIASATKDDTLPALSLDRVWITTASRAKLLDFPVTLGTSVAGGVSESPQAFLNAVARRGLGDSEGTGLSRPLPLAARLAIESLERGAFSTPADAAGALSATADGADRVSRARRAIATVAAGAPVVIAVLAVAAAWPVVRATISPEVQTMADGLRRIEGLSKKSDAASNAQRLAFETYTAGRFGPWIANDRFWLGPGSAFKARQPLALKVLAAHPRVSADDVTRAAAEIQPLLDADAKDHITPSIIVALLLTIVLTASALMSLGTAVASRGGLTLRVLGMAVVGKTGEPASRLRVLVRTLIAWSPVALIWIYYLVARAQGLKFDKSMAHVQVPLAAIALLLVGALWSVIRPERGIQDRLAGTWVVPR